VREPGRWSRLVAVVAVVALVGGGLLWRVGDGEPERDDHAEEPLPGISGDWARATRTAFAEAVRRLGRAGSFAYRGSVHAAAASPFRPGATTAADVTVEGSVLLQHALTREVAVDATGRAVETVTSGPTVWTRMASTADGLADAPWEFRTLAGPSTLAMAAVAELVEAAGHARGEVPDATGRRVIRATLPAGDRQPVTRATLPSADRLAGYGGPLAGADLLLSLDEDGDIARMVVSSLDDRELVLEFDIVSLGETQAIAPPDSGDAALRRTVPVDKLEAAGLRPVELGQVPAGWELTGAWVAPGPVRSAECPILNLSYRDPDAVLDSSMWLWVTSEMCGGWTAGVGEQGSVRRRTSWSSAERLTTGSFEGTVVEFGSSTTGTLFNGTIGVGFLTDLSAEAAATVLASLRPFDPETQPIPLTGIPSA
jgi:hypothetical protein